MTQAQKEYIEQNIDLIQDSRWVEFFKEAPIGIGGVLYEAGIDFMEQMKEIPYGCFKNFSIDQLVIPSGITRISASAFEDCTKLTSITLPNSVTSIDDSAFYGCSSLASVTIPDSVTSIRKSAFEHCDSLTSITIPNSVTSIGDYAFYYCTGLTSVTIPNSVTSIGYKAFFGCRGLTSITIPNTVTSISNWAFRSIGNEIHINYNGTQEEWKSILSREVFKGTRYECVCTDGIVKKGK